MIAAQRLMALGVNIAPIDFDVFPSDLGKYCFIGMESSLVPLVFSFNPEIKIEIINNENGLRCFQPFRLNHSNHEAQNP